MHPTEHKLLIRAFKVTDARGHWSQCLVCAGYYDSALAETPASFDKAKGWFV
jgi:hypothetical protein